jgi:predicted RNA methylase
MVKKTGKNRDPKDQFYTNPGISEYCINVFQKTADIDVDDILLEPSAGSGSFSDILIEQCYNVDAYDIEPKKEYIKKQNYLELNYTKYNDKNVHCIGNPPFGPQSSLAKKFIKQSCEFCETIAFILPKSFRKDSFQKSFPLNFHLVEEIDLPKKSFIVDGVEYGVPCIFQIWIKKDTERYVEPIVKEKGFHFISKPGLKDTHFNEEGNPIKRENIFVEEPDFGILRAGGGKKCGRISKDYKDGIACYPEAWLFIKIDDKYDKEEFYEEYKKINWIDDSNVGAKSINKQKFIRGINKVLERF